MSAKTSFFSKGIILGMILAAVCGVLSGQTKPDALGFDSGVYDYHFRRADRETSPEGWIAGARQGLRMAKNAWEQIAAELYGDRALLAEAAQGIDAWGEAELEARFTRWLLTRFFASGAGGEDAVRQIRDANLPYIYHLDENGNIRYDEESGDPLLIRPGEEGRDLEAEQKQWRDYAEGIVDAESSRYGASLAAGFPELLSYIPEERREAFALRLGDLVREAVSGRRREFEALIAREERLLTARRTGDVWSLRKKSEAEAASVIAGQLIEEAGGFCTRGIAALEERIEAAEAGTGDLALAGKEWLDAYREQFERGLKAWEEAEERFFIRRIEWEQEAGQHYLEGEETWSGAFNRLEQERQNWEAKAKTLFEAGAALFRQASENLEAAISEAKAEFEGDVLIRMDAGAGRAKAWVDSYITCGSVAAAARENIAFWLSLYPQKNAPALDGGAFSPWIAGELSGYWRGALDRLETWYGSGDSLAYQIRSVLGGMVDQAGQAVLLEELKRRGIPIDDSFSTALELQNWAGIYDTYMVKAREARDALIHDFKLVMGTGALADILDQGAVSEDFNLDEYQIELIRAKAVAGYWEKRVTIAGELVAYAEELTAGRMTDGEGVKAWEEAKGSYDAALLRYEAEISRLNTAGAGVARAQEALYEAAASLRESESKLEEMNRSYAILMSSYAVGRNDFILDDLAAKYRELLGEYGLLRAVGDNAVYVRYLERARALGFAQEIENSGNLLKRLVLGGEGIGASLSALAEAASKIRVLEEKEPLPHSIADFGIGEGEPLYELLGELLAQAEKGESRDSYDRLIRNLVRTAKAQAETLLETRVRAMDLLIAPSAAEWYFSMRGRAAGEAEKAAFVRQGLEFNLIRDNGEAQLALLKARLALELEGLSRVAGKTGEIGSDPRAELLARFCPVDPEAAAECLGALGELGGLLDSAENLQGVLDAAAQGNPLISWFLQGGSFFESPSGQPLGFIFLTEELSALKRSRDLLDLYGIIGLQTQATAQEAGLRALQGMGEVFRSAGVTFTEGCLPGVKALGDALLTKAGAVEQNLSALLSALDEQTVFLPSWLQGELPAWRASLIDYLAARLVYSGKTMTSSGAQLAQQDAANAAQIEKVEAVYEALLYATPGSPRALSAALELEPALFSILDPEDLAEEAVRRIALDLARGRGPIDPEDEGARGEAEAALAVAAARDHGYAAGAIRNRAVEAALLLLTGEAVFGGSAQAEGDYYHEALAEELAPLYETLSRRGRRLADEYALWTAIEAVQKTIVEAGQEGKSHWRSYISGDFLRDYNDNSKNQNNPLKAGVTGQPGEELSEIKAAASWREGLLADAYEKAALDTRMLNQGFLMFVSGAPGDRGELQEGIRGYRENPLLGWDETLIRTVEYAYYDRVYLEGSEVQKRFAYQQALEQEIQRLGAGYERSKQSSGAIKAELETLSRAITAQQEQHQLKVRAYGNAAGAFASAGAAYDSIYEAVKREYTAMEDARFAYEIQDALRRWASTAYLGTADPSTLHYKNPAEELSYARERYTRADAALSALAGLYDSGETRRPYADREYEALYAEYTKSFQRMLAASKALSVLEGAIAEEVERNNRYYDSYTQALEELGRSLSYSSDYQSPADKSLWQIQDLLRIKDGRLAFACNDSFVLQSVDQDEARGLQVYFDISAQAMGELHGTTQFEAALRRLSGNLESYGVTTKAETYRQWGLARDYLMRQLIEKNGEIEALKGYYHNAKAMNPGENLGSMPIEWHFFSKDVPVSNAASSYRNKDLLAAQKSAWESLSASERADLEFYTILTLLGGGGEDVRGFSQVSEQEEFLYIRKKLSNELLELSLKTIFIPFVGLVNIIGIRKIEATRNKLTPSLEEVKKNVAEGRASLKTSLDSINAAFQLYDGSNKKLAQLNGTGPVDWARLETALGTSGKLTGQEINALAGYWEDMLRESGGSYRSISDALNGLARWSRTKKEDLKNSLERAWGEDEQERAVHEAGYREVFDAYIEGRADMAALNRAARAAYGPSAPAGKNHLENLERTIMRDLQGVTEDGAAYGTEYAGLAEELAGLIRRAYGARYNAELAAREQEWALQRYDLQEKYTSWTEASGLILERGRLEWKEGVTRMQEAYGAWAENFAGEYRRVSEAWDGAYLAGLEDKAAWVALSSEAANNAASGALLAMAGSEADRMIRAMDTRIPLTGFTGAEEAGEILARVLGAGGIVNLEDAAGGLRGLAGTLSGQVRRGLGGLRVWDAGMVQAAAAKLAREANEELAAREAKRIAVHVQGAVRAVLDQLYANVKDANEDFRKNMDEVFILEGQWRRSGKNYMKNAIVHSTLFTPIITESVSVEGYRDYVMDPVTLSTDLNENRLKNLDALAIQGLLENMYAEIDALAAALFGAGDEDPGLLGDHIGKDPQLKNNDVDIDKGKGALFSDPGSGELGRLLQDYIYWTIREGNGISAVNAAFWEKPLWDSRGSWFQAPTMRGVVDIGLRAAVSALSFTGVGAVAAIALNAGLNLVDDLAFGVLDAAGGYKTWDEAGFEFGKKAVISAASSAASGLTGIVAGGFNFTGAAGVLTETGVSGIDALTTGTLTSALGGISYNSRDGWGYDRAAFFDSWKNAGIGALSTMSAAFTGGMMNWGLDGFTGNLYADGTKLSSLAGSLSAQGVNYVFNEDFALNLLNLSDISGGRIDSGLLELHIGSSGISAGLGAGGADISAGVLTGAFRGLEAWKANARILGAKAPAARSYAAQMRTLYSGDRENRAEFEAALAGRTRYMKNRYVEESESLYNEATGIKTVVLGRDALEEGSRFGLNVLFSHEAYRNGRDDGEEGQIAERDRAVEGHINTALDLMKTYGEGSVSAGLRGEALWYDYARSIGDYEFTGAIRGAYDTSGDFWQLTKDGGLKYDGNGYLRDVDGLYMNYDGTKTADIQRNTVGSKGIETGLMAILNLAATAENSAQIQDMMIRSGLWHTVDPNNNENRDKWMWNGAAEEANMGIVISQNELKQWGMVQLDASLLPGSLVERALRMRETARPIPERTDLQPKKDENEKVIETYCNKAFIDTIKALSVDSALLKEIENAGIANKIGLYLQQDDYAKLGSGLTAQMFANMGQIVAVSYINPKYDVSLNNNAANNGHLAVVMANYGTYIPALGPRISQAGAKNGQYWAWDPQTFGSKAVRPNTSYYTLNRWWAKEP